MLIKDYRLVSRSRSLSLNIVRVLFFFFYTFLFEDPVFKCPLCDASGFDTADALNVHVNTAHFADELSPPARSEVEIIGERPASHPSSVVNGKVIRPKFHASVTFCHFPSIFGPFFLQGGVRGRGLIEAGRYLS